MAASPVPDVSSFRLESVLKTQFGYNSFRLHQREVVTQALKGRDCFVLMATGSGKSLCYQILPLLANKPVVVVSPLISLMQDQVMSLESRGISACALGSMQSSSRVYEDAKDGKYSLIYLTPEKLVNWTQCLRNLHRKVGIACFAIDEAHCLSEWGHDFRTAYRELGIIRREFPSVPLMALTATATPKVANDIKQSLTMSPSVYHAQSTFNRPNLSYTVSAKRSIKQDISPMLIGEDSAIVYCLRRHDCEEVRVYLSNLSISCGAYHAGLSDRERKQVHERFLRSEIQVVVATVAFGMGIDKPDIRTVIHYGLPKSVEAYYQQSGRAGRDGLPSKCYLFWSTGDFRMEQFFLLECQSAASRQRVAALFGHMKSFVAENSTCRRIQLLKYFGEIGTLPNTCGNCDNCVNRKNQIIRDFTREARFLAMAVRDTNQRFGIQVPIQVVKGDSTKLLSRKFPVHAQNRPSYAKLTDRTQKWLSTFSQMLMHRNVLQEHYEKGFRQVRLGPAGRELLSNPNMTMEFVVPAELLACDLALKRELRKTESDAKKSKYGVSLASNSKTSSSKQERSFLADRMDFSQASSASPSRSQSDLSQFSAARKRQSASALKRVNSNPVGNGAARKKIDSELEAALVKLESNDSRKRKRMITGFSPEDFGVTINKRLKRVTLYTLPPVTKLEHSTSSMDDGDIVLPTTSSKDDGGKVDLNEQETKLLDALKKHRKEEARKRNMPSYSVVEEIVLRRFAKLRPIDKAAMKAVNGVSKVFWKRFGPSFSGKIVKVSKSLGLETNVSNDEVGAKAPKSEVKQGEAAKKPYEERNLGVLSLPEETSDHAAIYESYEKGIAISTIITERGISRNTIEERLGECLLLGKKVDASRLNISDDIVSQAFAIFDESGIDLPESQVISRIKCLETMVTPGNVRFLLYKYIAERTRQVPFQPDSSSSSSSSSSPKKQKVDNWPRAPSKALKSESEQSADPVGDNAKDGNDSDFSMDDFEDSPKKKQSPKREAPPTSGCSSVPPHRHQRSGALFSTSAAPPTDEAKSMEVNAKNVVDCISLGGDVGMTMESLLSAFSDGDKPKEAALRAKLKGVLESMVENFQIYTNENRYFLL